MMEESRSVSMSARSGAPGPRQMPLPTMSSSVRGPHAGGQGCMPGGRRSSTGTLAQCVRTAGAAGCCAAPPQNRVHRSQASTRTGGLVTVRPPDAGGSSAGRRCHRPPPSPAAWSTPSGHRQRQTHPASSSPWSALVARKPAASRLYSVSQKCAVRSHTDEHEGGRSRISSSFARLAVAGHHRRKAAPFAFQLHDVRPGVDHELGIGAHPILEDGRGREARTGPAPAPGRRTQRDAVPPPGPSCRPR